MKDRNKKPIYYNRKSSPSAAFQATVKGNTKQVEELGTTIQTNEYQALFVPDFRSIEAKNKARWTRLLKHVALQSKKSEKATAARLPDG